MKKLIFLLLIVLSFIDIKAQFPSTDSLRNYNIVWITNNSARAFTNYRLHTLIAGMIDWIDSARLTGTGSGGSFGIDSIAALNDSTIRYRKDGTFRSFTIKGVYDYRRKVDTVYKTNDSTIAYTVNGTQRTFSFPGRINFVDSIYRKVGKDSLFYRRNNIEYALLDSTGGIINQNVGLGLRILKPGTQELKTLFFAYGLVGDSTTNTDGLTFKVDTTGSNGLVTRTELLDSLDNTTQVDSPLYVKAGSGGDPDTLSIYRGTTTVDGYLSASDKKKYDSAYAAFYNAFGGDTSIIIRGFILRPTIDGSGNVTWALIDDSDHDPLNMSATVSVSSSSITVNYPTSIRVVTRVGAVDEQLQMYGIQLGPSTGLSSASIQLSMISNWGGYIHVSGGVYTSTGVYNGAAPTPTHNQTTGQIALAVTGIETGGVQDHYKIAVVNMVGGYTPSYDITASTNTSQKFYLNDAFGNPITGPPINGTGWWWRGPTWWRNINPSSMGGSLSWMQNIFTSSSNIWFIGVFKKG